MIMIFPNLLVFYFLFFFLAHSRIDFGEKIFLNQKKVALALG